jgi:hypothetical protein
MFALGPVQVALSAAHMSLIAEIVARSRAELKRVLAPIVVAVKMLRADIRSVGLRSNIADRLRRKASDQARKIREDALRAIDSAMSESESKPSNKGRSLDVQVLGGVKRIEKLPKAARGR